MLKKLILILLIFNISAVYGQGLPEMPEKFRLNPSGIELSGIPGSQNYFDCCGREAVLMGDETVVINVSVEEDEEKTYFAQIEGKPQVFTITKAVFDKLFSRLNEIDLEKESVEGPKTEQAE